VTGLYLIFVYYHIGGLRIGSYQQIMPYLLFIPIPTPPKENWYCKVSLTLSGPANITVKYVQSPVSLNNGTVNDDKKLYDLASYLYRSNFVEVPNQRQSCNFGKSAKFI